MCQMQHQTSFWAFWPLDALPTPQGKLLEAKQIYIIIQSINHKIHYTIQESGKFGPIVGGFVSAFTTLVVITKQY